jgi:small-conductance mechanosensitive channel
MSTTMIRSLVTALAVGAMVIVLGFVHVVAQEPSDAVRRSLQGLTSEALANLINTAHPDVPATLKVANREIVVFRAAAMGRSAADRAAAAARLIDQIDNGIRAVAVASRRLETAFIVTIDGQDAFAILPADVDPLLGEAIDAKASDATRHLQQALDERAETRRPGLILRALGLAAVSTLGFLGLLWVLARVYRTAAHAVQRKMDQALAHSRAADEIIRASIVPVLIRRALKVAVISAGLFATYVWLTFLLRRFPYTRPWGESLRSFLIDRLAWLFDGFAQAVPGLFTVVLVIFLTRLVIRSIHIVFLMAEEGRIQLPWVYPETASTSRKLVTAIVCVFALVASYPYLPGSNTEAFKGISVMLGVIISLGSSGLANQVMSGFTVTYSRALRVGDFVQIGDILGTVTYAGLLSTKLDTVRREEVTIPNAVLMSQVVTNYSRHATTKGLAVTTEVTIGYDVPWRQVEALLLVATRRTAGVRSDPQPFVLQTALEDFFVRYRLVVSVEQPARRLIILNELHANIQDAFNEQGVQIMSPHYESDPQAPKLVPKERWFPRASSSFADTGIKPELAAREAQASSLLR